ncbi:MAG: AI-2E family transporter, partial [Acidimicrobiia bacterium]|nr:AI-2E family transporter [Acidimicrobiia bacterium]
MDEDRLKRFGFAAWAIVGGFLVAAIVVWLLLQVRIVWAPVIFATAIVYLLHPFVTRLRKFGVPRLLGAAVAYLLFGGLLVFLFVVLAPVVSQQATALAEQLPVVYDDSIGTIEKVAADLGITGVNLLSYDELIGWFSAPDSNLQEELTGLAERAFSLALGLAEVLVLFIVTPVIAFYVLVDLPGLQETSRSLLPLRYRDEAIKLGSNLGKAFGGFVRGQLLVAVVVALLSSTGLLVLGLDLWLIIGILAGLFNLVPFIGPWISGFIAVVVSLVLGDLRLALGVALLFLGVQQLDNHIISPLVLRATVKLHPSVIILALLAGGSLGGFLGLAIAVPLTALAKVFISHVWRTRVLGEPWEAASD